MAYMDEITLAPESFFTMLLTRLSVSGAKLFGTTNPDSPSHWLKREYIDKAEEKNINVYHFRLEDNNYLMDKNPGYIEQMKASFSGVWYKRLILGEWCVADGAIYPQFDEWKHLFEVGERRFRYYIVGVDYGTTNPTAFTLLGFDSPFKEKYVVKEFFWDSKIQRRQKTDSEYVDDLMKFITGYRVGAIYVDPSAASFITQLRKSGIIPREANNEVLDGIRFVSSELTKGNLYVDKSCENLIREFQTYTWDEEKSSKKGMDVPMKEEDHVCVTGDTLVDTLSGQIAIKDLVGMSGLVYSYDGEGKVIEQYSNVTLTQKDAEILEIEVEDGRVIKCTKDHPVLTQRGWVVAGELTLDDEILQLEGVNAEAC